MSDIIGGVIRGLLPGFEPAVRCVLKDIGQFRLVELEPDGERAVECSKEVQEAFDQAFYGVSDARDGITRPRDRVNLARALYHLYLEARDGASAGGFGFAPKIAETLGRMIAEAMQADDVESAINSCASSFKAALRGVAADNSRLPHKRRPAVPITKTPNLDGEVFDKHAAAMFLGFSTRTVDTWVSKKRIPFVKLPGGAIRFRRSQLIEFLKRYEVGV